MSEVDNLLAQYTEKGNAKIHGAMMKCVDKNGKELYSKIAGYDSLSPDASPLREDAVLKVASATKIITAIALLQCIDQGLIGLDEPLTKILPELDGKEILKSHSEAGFVSEPSKNKITARQLLSHTSGYGYQFLHPLLIKWVQTPEGSRFRTSKYVPERYNIPLVYEPGTGWLYGVSLDWAGVVVRRLHGGMSLEDYMIENIWKRVGLSSPFPTFALSQHPEYNARLMQNAGRTPDGGLKPGEYPFGDNPVDQEGGAGLVATMRDYMAVLADLISDAPKLLKPETVALMFEPQIPWGSKGISMLKELRPVWDVLAGPVQEDSVNYGLGGLLLTDGAAEIGQPKNMLTWGGALNTIWFISRDAGVAGFFSTQISPFGDSIVKEVVDAWRKEFWSKLKS